jgi:DNA (cytosine-5)-methyltransferase 1
MTPKKQFRVLDLYCCAGGAAAGYARDGSVSVTGIDIAPQPNYPYTFIQADVLVWLAENMDYVKATFDMIHASPPCQAYLQGAKWAGNEYPDLMEPTRQLLIETGLPYVIENVQNSPLIDPIRLCGEMFGLRVLRHRLFESNFTIPEPTHIKHRPMIDATHSYYACVAGHGGNSYSFKLEDWQAAMEIDWTTKKELTQSIPPAYTEYIWQEFLNDA